MKGRIKKGLSRGLQATGIVFLLCFLEPQCLYASGESLSYKGKLPPTKKVPFRWGRDPFVPLVKGAAELPLMELKAVFFSAEKASAIINDKLLYTGSVIEGQKIIAIGKSHVILQGKSGTIRLELDTMPEFSHDKKESP
jgi:hypothetical protein